MLLLKPICEHCGKALPNESKEAMICSFECTFCKDCASTTLNNKCPNCGGNFESRPVRHAKSAGESRSEGNKDHNVVSISSDKKKLNLPLIHQFISNTYWAQGRTEAEMKTCIDHSFCMGIYKGEEQIGFARVVTDYFQFAYLMDVFIIEKQRGNGYAGQLLTALFSHQQLKMIKVWRLATSDAHGVYKKFGFTALSAPENMMERKL